MRNSNINYTDSGDQDNIHIDSDSDNDTVETYSDSNNDDDQCNDNRNGNGINIGIDIDDEDALENSRNDLIRADLYFEKILSNHLNKTNADKRICTNCKYMHDKTMFTGKNGNITKTCNNCRLKNKLADEKRKDRVRDWSAEAKKNPDRKVKNAEWKKKNPDNVAKHRSDHAARKKSAIGEDELKKQKAEYMKQYRANKQH